MNGRVAIIGAGQFAQEIGDMLVECGMDIVGCVSPEPKDHSHFPWLGGDEVLAGLDPDIALVIAIGKPSVRARLSQQLGHRLKTFIHPAAWVAPSARLEPGVIVYPNATVHAQVLLERGVVINSNASIGHHTRIGAFTNANPGCSLGGSITIGARCVIGLGAAIREQITIGDDVIIGAGAAVVCDLPEPGTYLGVPARKVG